VKALETNTHLANLKLSNSNLQREQGTELAQAARVNTTLKILNIESNDLTAEILKTMATKIGENTDTSLEQWLFGFQKSMGDSLGASLEQGLVQLMKSNVTIVRLAVSIKEAGARDNIDRYILRNVDRARRLAAGDAGEEEVVAEVRTFSALTLCSPPGKSASDVFADDADTVAIVRAFCAEKLTVPTKEQLQSFAKNQGQSVPFAKVAPVMKSFVQKLLDAAVDVKVILTDSCGTDAPGTLRRWQAPTENNWSF